MNYHDDVTHPLSALPQRRFNGVARLYGEQAFERFKQAKVCVVGIGGVGSWALEALARSGIGNLVAVDLDMIAESNTNRQIHALESQFGKAKVEAMAARISEINPECRIETIEEFISDENLTEVITTEFDWVIDAIDQRRIKASMVAHCKRIGVNIVVAGAAGGKLLPTEVKTADLSRTTQDPLLAKVRAELRKKHGFPCTTNKRFGVTAIFSSEPVRFPKQEDHCGISSNLNCTGFGSSVCVTATFGMFAASTVLSSLSQNVATKETIS